MYSASIPRLLYPCIFLLQLIYCMATSKMWPRNTLPPMVLALSRRFMPTTACCWTRQVMWKLTFSTSGSRSQSQPSICNRPRSHWQHLAIKISMLSVLRMPVTGPKMPTHLNNGKSEWASSNIGRQRAAIQSIYRERVLVWIGDEGSCTDCCILRRWRRGRSS